jgi:hypothetical protein
MRRDAFAESGAVESIRRRGGVTGAGDRRGLDANAEHRGGADEVGRGLTFEARARTGE